MQTGRHTDIYRQTTGFLKEIQTDRDRQIPQTKRIEQSESELAGHEPLTLSW